ncbi:Octanoyltransferase [Galdieria sulphuraria]|nr:Octanoyltransferase [Galdieria sulphuraria]
MSSETKPTFYKRPCWFYNLSGYYSYQTIRNWQLQLRQERMEPSGENLPDVLLMLEHQPVYTLGTAANEEFIKFDVKHPPCELYRIERGGEITFHGPGQLIFYPILNLRFHKKDLRWYLRRLEQVVIETLKTYGLEAYRVEGLTGVWLDEKKIAAIGIAASKWVTMHGVALNVTNDLEPFRKIVPCGIHDREVGRLVDYVPNIDMQHLRTLLAECFADMFQLSLVPYEE